MAFELRNIKVLIADDDYSNAELVISFLNGLTDQISYAPNGMKACDLAASVRPDLIVMDWQMPTLSGIEALKKLQASAETREIPVIITTGVMISAENLREAFEAGAVDFLRKPFNPVEFIARAKSVLRIKNQHNTIRKILIEEKECLTQLVENKDREITSMAAFDYQRNSMLTGLLEHLKQLTRITGDEYAADVKQIEKQLHRQLDLEKSWDKFKHHFDKVHTKFFEKLDREYPLLSLNERKLCAYIKMGMGNFEISETTGSSDLALRKAINRLKKKLDLKADQDLRKFIFNF